MENILYDFNEKVISLVTNCLKNSITERGIADFTNDLESEMIKFGSKVTQFLVEYAENIIFKSKKTRVKEQEEWTIIENHHEPIIDKEVFEKVQKIREQRKKESDKYNHFS